MKRFSAVLFILAFAAVCSAASVHSKNRASSNNVFQDYFNSRAASDTNMENVQTLTVWVPMRDKITLKTTLYFYPSIVKSRPVSAILYRTPYNIDSNPNYLIKITQISQMVLVAQDFRGRWGSNGTFSFWRDSANDAYDTMEWITSQTWSTKKIYRYVLFLLYGTFYSPTIKTTKKFFFTLLVTEVVQKPLQATCNPSQSLTIGSERSALMLAVQTFTSPCFKMAPTALTW